MCFQIYIFEGHLHIISKSEFSNVKNVLDGANIVRENPRKTIAREEIQRDVKHRIKDYPKKITALMHTAHCYIPAFLGKILDYKPQLIASIVDSFWNRDAIDLKVCFWHLLNA